MEKEGSRPVVKRLSEHIFAVESPYDGVAVRNYLVVGETAAMVDTGLKSTGGVIVELLDSLGSPQVLAAIHTHGHWDHIGSAAEVQEATNCLIAAHIEDAQMIASYAENDRRFIRRFPKFPPTPADWRAVYDRMGPQVRVDLQLTGGECFNLGQGVVLQVVPMPGHTPGSVGIFEHSSGALFTGDALAGRGAYGTLAQYEDVPAYRESIGQVKELSVRELLTGHFEPITGREVQSFLEDCLDEVDQIEKTVREVAEKESDLVSLAQEVCRRMNKPFMMQPLLTTQAHLQDLSIHLPERRR